ncbi:HOG1 [Symbiodinium sp. CCMP2592]|nr:HOG1 [Symbiodinium sp. CCMP2592]
MANSSAEEGEQSLVEVYSLGGKLLAKLPRPAESSLTSLEEALNLQAEDCRAAHGREHDDDDLGLVWRLAHSGPLGAEPLFATREPLLQVKVRELCDEVYALPSMYIQVRKMLQFKNVHGSAVKEDGKQYPSRILFRRTEASDLQMAERLYNEFMFLLIWRNENFVVVQDLFVAPAASGGCWTSMAAVLRSPMHLHLTTNHADWFLHSLGYAHGNVCPSNVWLNANEPWLELLRIENLASVPLVAGLPIQ